MNSLHKLKAKYYSQWTMPTQEPRIDIEMKLCLRLWLNIYASTALINQILRSGISDIAYQ